MLNDDVIADIPNDTGIVTSIDVVEQVVLPEVVNMSDEVDVLSVATEQYQSIELKLSQLQNLQDISKHLVEHRTVSKQLAERISLTTPYEFNISLLSYSEAPSQVNLPETTQEVAVAISTLSDETRELIGTYLNTTVTGTLRAIEGIEHVQINAVLSIVAGIAKDYQSFIGAFNGHKDLVFQTRSGSFENISKTDFRWLGEDWWSRLAGDVSKELSDSLSILSNLPELLPPYLSMYDHDKKISLGILSDWLFGDELKDYIERQRAFIDDHEAYLKSIAAKNGACGNTLEWFSEESTKIHISFTAVSNTVAVFNALATAAMAMGRIVKVLSRFV